MSVVSLMAVIAQFGFPLLATRESATADAQNFRLKSAVSWFLLRSGALSVVIAIVCALVALSLRDKHISAANIWYAAGVTVVIAWSPTITGLLRGLGRNLTAQVADLLLRPLLTMAALFVLYENGVLSIGFALVAQTFAVIVTMALCFTAIKDIVVRKGDGLAWPPPPEWLRTSTAFFASAILQALNSNYPMIVAGFFVTPAELGAFRVALASVALIGLPTAAANISLTPVIANLSAKSDWIGLNRAMAHTTLATFITTLFGVCVLALVGRELITIAFGADYRSAYWPLMVLCLAQLIVSGFGVSGSFLNMTGRERLAIRAFAIAVPIGLFIAVPMTAAFGVCGAAAGNVVMVTLWHWIVLYLHRHEVSAPLSVFAAVRFLRKTDVRPC
jgi:O-antigen/teichoic acid export membrane protein